MIGLACIACAGACDLVFVYIDCVAIFCGVVVFAFWIGLGGCCYGCFAGSVLHADGLVLSFRFGWRWRNADFLVLSWIRCADFLILVCLAVSVLISHV